MSTQLKSSSLRVQEFLSQHGQEFVILQMPSSTRTAVEAADAIGCTVSQIAKSVIFRHAETSEPVLVVTSGSNMVSADKLKQATGIVLKRADAEFVRERVGYAIGGVPPIAHKSTVHVFLDQDIKQFDEIWAAAGTPNTVFKLTPMALGELTGGQWLDVAK